MTGAPTVSLPSPKEGLMRMDACNALTMGGPSDGLGSCTRIPQASSEGPEAKAIRSPRASMTKLPTLVSQGLLFVWPDENGWEKAANSEPPMLPDDFNDPGFSTVMIQRDNFYGYDTLMENVSDPSHIEFAQHRVIGRRDRAKPLPFKLESSGAWGCSGSNAGNPCIGAKFFAPSYVINNLTSLSIDELCRAIFSIDFSDS
ncbi:pheophorbide a oxygenase, chloroplastic [Iris pallida]|uniref:Pheophorbide a oxygenase, chloroplastic n=1 Tax=Iris pallida TaxID=29817 RepID=A0AAX6IGP3_IRIPA|nr:pheophorbide a oxygenase, chloroplastic [Iris pallida]